MTLVEVVLATGIAAVFLTAFMVQYRVQHSSFQVASDELRLPPLGYTTANRMLGPEGLLVCYQPTASSPIVEVRPERVTLPRRSREADTVRQLRFEEVAKDPRPSGSRPGRVVAADFTNITLDRETDLSPQTLIATMSFYSPDMLTTEFFTDGNVDTEAYAKPGAVCVPGGGAPAFYFLGAASRGEVVTKDMAINHAPGSGTWTFSVGSTVITREFEAGETFFLDFGEDDGGVLACAWPLAPNQSPVAGGLRYNILDKTTAKRIGFWFQLNAGPYTGEIAFRDSAFLRY